MDRREALREALAALEQERRQLDEDIVALQRILARQDPPPSTSITVAVPAASPSGAKGTVRGSAEREILQLLANGGVWTPAEIGRIRGTTSNAASNVLRRLHKKRRVAFLGGGRYQNLGDQGSLPVGPERDNDEATEGGGPSNS